MSLLSSVHKYKGANGFNHKTPNVLKETVSFLQTLLNNFFFKPRGRGKWPLILSLVLVLVLLDVSSF